MKKGRKLPRCMKHEGRTFWKGMLTDEYVFYCDYKEGDGNGCTLMYDHNMRLISNNYHAFNSFYSRLIDGRFNWLSRTNRYNRKEILKENK